MKYWDPDQFEVSGLSMQQNAADLAVWHTLCRQEVLMVSADDFGEPQSTTVGKIMTAMNRHVYECPLLIEDGE